MRIIKKDGTLEDFNGQKIVNAVTKSAARVMVKISDEQFQWIVNEVIRRIHEKGLEDVPIYEMHNIVESVLDQFNPDVAKSYRDYRNYKKDFVHMMDEVYMRSQSIRFIGDKENSNADSTLVATKRCLIFNELNKRLYRKFFLTKDELQASNDGYIYIHDQSARLDTMNCFERMTKFITKEGVKSFYDFEDGDKVVVMSHKGIWRNAVVHQYGEQPVQEILFTSQGIRRAILATKNHRWILKDGSETTSIKVGDELCVVPEEKYAKRNWTVKEIIPLNNRNKVPVWCLEVEGDHSFLLEAGIPTGNCCLSDIGSIMKGGFEMGNIWYNEPKTLDVAFDVLGDIILATAAQQYGGYTVPEVDKILAPYAKKSYDRYMRELEALVPDAPPNIQEERVMKKVKRDFEQGFQGIEMKLNTVGSSRGDYPFITMTFGLATDKFGKLASKTFLEVHMKGQGKEGFKKPVLFPKLVFLYDEKIHGPGGVNEDVFEAGIRCSAKTMYPDWLSLSGEGYVAEMYQKYGKVISPMGCRAFLAPWYERGGMAPVDENDVPVFVGRFNVGAVSLHLPLILAKARRESRDFYEVLDYYLEMIRGIHKRTYDYIGEMKASVNPVMFCEGGFYGGHLKPTDKVKPLLKPMTASFGITALNELQELYNGKSIREDGEFALEVMRHINDKLAQFKKEDGWLYAVYGTPAERLCSLQIDQFRQQFGIIDKVSDRPYVSNSFHCHVTEDMSPIEKQDCEERFWNLFNGGKIQYVRYPVSYNIDAVRTLVRRAMKKGFYEGVNLSLAYCDDCGHQELEMDVCPVCGSRNLTKIDRMNGYLSYSRIHGDTRLNAGKMAEIAERVSM